MRKKPSKKMSLLFKLTEKKYFSKFENFYHFKPIEPP